MMKFFHFILILLFIGLVGCVDSNYDLTGVSTDDIEIGSDESVFTLPVATIILTSDDLSNSSGDVSGYMVTRTTSMSLQEMLDLANAFLPAGVEVNIADLTDSTIEDGETLSVSELYIETLTATLIGELKDDETKAEALAEILLSDEYDLDTDDVFTALGVDSEDTSVEALTTAIQTTASSSDTSSLTDAITDVISSDVIAEIDEYSGMSIEESVDSVDVADILDMLGSGEIKLVATYEHDFPFKFTLGALTISNGVNEDIEFSITEVGVTNDGSEVDLDDLAEILESGATIKSDITLETYSAVSTSGDETLKIKLVLKKFGSISL